eukprot:gene7231-559_t
MSDRGDTKLMNSEWVSRMKCEPFISKGKKTVLYISITTTEHIDGIAEEELSNLIRTEVKYNERLNEAPTVMKFVEVARLQKQVDAACAARDASEVARAREAVSSAHVVCAAAKLQ